jgi:hypothetical protein
VLENPEEPVSFDFLIYFLPLSFASRARLILIVYSYSLQRARVSCASRSDAAWASSGVMVFFKSVTWTLECESVLARSGNVFGG